MNKDLIAYISCKLCLQETIVGAVLGCALAIDVARARLPTRYDYHDRFNTGFYPSLDDGCASDVAADYAGSYLGEVPEAQIDWVDEACREAALYG